MMNQTTTWTLESLKEHYDIILKNQDEHYKSSLIERDERLSQRYDAMQLAITKAEIATEKRFEGVNEFRAQLGDQSRLLMPRIETEVLLHGVNEKIINLSLKIEKSENMKAGGSIFLVYVIAGVSLFVSIMTILGNFNII